MLQNRLDILSEIPIRRIWLFIKELRRLTEQDFKAIDLRPSSHRFKSGVENDLVDGVYLSQSYI